MPRRDDGAFDVAACEAWVAAREDSEDRGGEDGAAGSLPGWKLRRERAAALKAERELAEVGKTLIPRTEHERIQAGLVESFVAALDALPAKVVPLLAGARSANEMDAILRDHVRALRIQLAAKHSPKPIEEP